MNLKKLTAILCSAAMAFSVISTPVMANAEAAEKYLLVNDQFASGDVGSWVQHKHSDADYGSLTTTDIGDGNYALVYETTDSNWSNDYIKRVMPDGQISLTDGVDIIVETKVKQTGSSGRSFFKYNLEDWAVEGYNEQEWNFKWGSLIVNNKGNMEVNAGWQPKNSTKYPGSIIYNYSQPSDFNINNPYCYATDALDKWYTYKVIIHGSTGGTANKASYYIYDESGTLVKSSAVNVSIDFPDNSSWAKTESGAYEAQNINWVEDVIKNFAFRFRDSAKLYIDYFKVWQEGVKVTDATATADLRNINVKLTSNGTLTSAIADYVTLYEPDGITLATVTKNFDAATGTVTFTSNVDYTAGAIYKVKFDTLNIANDISDDILSWEAPSELNVEAPACAAINLGIKGVLAPGTELEADYDLMPEGSVEGASEFIWYTVAPNGTKTEIGGQTGKTLAITSDYVDSTITYSVKPQCMVGETAKNGVWTECEAVVKPLSKPVASNPGYDKSAAMIGESLTAKYDYTDADGDEENGSVITWYKGSAVESDDYTEIASGSKINITEDLNGMYVKYSVIPKNIPVGNPNFRNGGDVLWSEPIGPVADVITASNMFVNSGLEAGDIAPFSFNQREGYKGITLVDKSEEPDGVYEGNYALHVHPRVDAADGFGQPIAVEANKAYIVSAMIKSATSDTWSNWEGLVGGGAGTNYRPFRDVQWTTITPDEWVRVSTTFVTSVSGENKPGVVCWGDWSKAEAYVDNLYVGELLISDIKTKEMKPVTIPKINEEEIEFSVLETDADGKALILNQFSETDGLTGQTATVTIADDIKGVTVKNNKLIIDSNAVAGKINIDITCIPNYNCTEVTSDGKIINYTITPAQSEFVKTVELELVAHNDKTPVAKNVDATGTVVAGNTLTGTYDFYQVDGKANASIERWMYCDTQDGTYEPIPGATGMTYVVGSDYADKFIKFEVTPKTYDGITGTSVSSVVLATPAAPYAENVAISGDFKVGGTITGTYKFVDVNRDEESGTVLKWYAIDPINGTPTEIAGASTATLVLTSDLTDKYIKFEVTPKSDADPKIGTEVLSDAYIGPVAPVAKEVSIKVDGKKLTGQYTYYHEHNARELEPLFKWTVDGQVVSTDSYYIVNFAGSKTVTFTVTPVGDTNPSTGKPVSVAAVITGTAGVVSGGGSGGGYGGGAGGSSGSGNIASGVGSINNLNYGEQSKTDDTKPEDTKTDESVTDLNGHWGADYIKKMEARGVITADENGKYNPDELVSREDMLTYLFKTLKLEKTDYSGMFEDVNDGEFAGILQTMVDNGTISKDTTFRPNDSISREEMCKILYISLENAGKLENVEDGLINSFADFGEISDWAVKYVNAMYGTKMMIGVSDECFAPKENLTKAQAATLLTRIIVLVEGE